MNAKLLGALFGLALGFVTPAKADYVVKDGNGVLQTIKAGVLGGNILPWMNMVDTTGAPLGTSSNPLALSFGTGVLLPAFAAVPHFICDSGCPSTVSLTGTLPAYAATPTFNIGSLNGAATSANQTAIFGSISGGSAANNSALVGGQYNLTPLTITDTQQAALQIDANGFLKVNIAAGAAAGGTSSTFGAAFPSIGTAVGMSQGGNMIALTGQSGNLNVQCANCSGSGVSTVDAAAFTASSSLFAGGGGFFQTTATNSPLTSGQQGMFQVTANRALFTNLRSSSGAEIGTVSVPIVVSASGNFPVTGTVTANLGTIAGVATQTTLASVLTALGSPFQAGGSIGNTSFSSTQSNAAALNATVVGTGTFAVQASQVGTWNVNNIAGTITLPTGAATSALQPTNVAANSTSAGQTGLMAMGATTTAAPTYATGTSNPFSLDTAGNLRVVVTGGSGGTSSSFGSPFPSTGTAIGLTNGTNMVAWSASSNYGTSPGAIPVPAVNAFVTNSPAVTNAGTFAVQLSGATNNINNISGTISLPNGAATAALQPTNAAQGSATSGQTGNLMQAAVLTSAPTYTTAQTSPLTMTTAGALRTDGSATTQPVSSATLATSALQTTLNTAIGVAGAAHSCATGTPATVVGCLGQLDDDVKGPFPVNVNGAATGMTGLTPGVAQTGTIVAGNFDLTSSAGTALGAMANYGTPPGAVKVLGVNAFITNTVAVTLTSTTITGTVAATLNTTPSLANGNGVVPTQGGAVLSATNGGFTNLLQGNAVIASGNPLFAQLTAGSAIVGNFRIDQTTVGTTNGVSLAQVGANAVSTGAGATGTGTQRVGIAQDTTTIAGSAPVKGGVGVVNGGSTWNTIAASQTAQSLSSTQGGATGAVGDYLSHCVVQPGTTSPGTVTVFDGTNTATNDAIAFPGGASSVGSLQPFGIPVGAISVNSGGWKVTTTTNVSVTCFGKFT